MVDKEKDELLFAAVLWLQQGKDEMFTQVYDLSEKYIYKIIYDIVKDIDTTQDLMQETYIQIYNKIDTLENPRAFYSWAGRIATNKTLRYIQSGYRKHESLVVQDEEGNIDYPFETASADHEEFIPESILMNQAEVELLTDIVDSLTPEQKICVQYYYYEEMSVGQIAEAFGCSEGTIKSRLNYARKSIKDAILKLENNQNTRLYSISGFPIFWMLFRHEMEQVSVPFSAAIKNFLVGFNKKSIATKVWGTTVGKTCTGLVVAAIVAVGGLTIANKMNEPPIDNNPEETESTNNIGESFNSTQDVVVASTKGSVVIRLRRDIFYDKILDNTDGYPNYEYLDVVIKDENGKFIYKNSVNQNDEVYEINSLAPLLDENMTQFYMAYDDFGMQCMKDYFADEMQNFIGDLESNRIITIEIQDDSLDKQYVIDGKEYDISITSAEFEFVNGISTSLCPYAAEQIGSYISDVPNYEGEFTSTAFELKLIGTVTYDDSIF